MRFVTVLFMLNFLLSGCSTTESRARDQRTTATEEKEVGLQKRVLEW